jgi:hypothetical protein
MPHDTAGGALAQERQSRLTGRPAQGHNRAPGLHPRGLACILSALHSKLMLVLIRCATVHLVRARRSPECT